MSLYETYYKQKNYDDAYPFWQNACEVCPAEGLPEHVHQGSQPAQAPDEGGNQGEEQRARHCLARQCVPLYDLRIEHFPSTSKKPDNGCEGARPKSHGLDGPEQAECLGGRPMFEESIACLEGRSLAATFDKYYTLLKTAFMDAEGAEAKTAAQEDLLEYLRLSDFIEAGRQNELAAGDSAGADKYATTQKNLDEVFVQVANCDEMVPVLEGKLNAAPDDIDTKKKALRLLNKKGCTDNAIFLPVAEAVYAVEKNADAAYSIGIQLAKKATSPRPCPTSRRPWKCAADCPKLGRNLMKAGQAAKNAGQVSKCIRYARRGPRPSQPTESLTCLLVM